MTDPLFELRREPAVLAAGAVHLPDWLDRGRQEFLLRACAGWVRRAGAHPVTLPGGGRMSVRTAWLGRRWEPYRYLDSTDVEPLPDWLVRAGRQAVAAAQAERPLAFVLWGAHAQTALAGLPRPIDLTLASAHPSPLSARRGFFGSRPFSRVNAWLTARGEPPIDWASGDWSKGA